MVYTLGFVNTLDMKLEDRAVGAGGNRGGDSKVVMGVPISSASVLGQTFQGQALGTQTWVCVDRLLSVLGFLVWGTALEDWLETPPHPALQTHKPTSGVNLPWEAPLVGAPSFLSTSPRELNPTLWAIQASR